MGTSHLWIGLTLLVVVDGTHGQETPATPGPPKEGCILTFKARDQGNIFNGSCSPIVFECGVLTGDQAAYVGDCGRFYVCDGRALHHCPCPDGTAFDVSANRCIDRFYANCSCPNGVTPPATTAAPVEATLAPSGGNAGRGNVAVGVGGGVAGLVAVLLVIAVVLIWRRHHIHQAKMMPSPFGQQASIKSGIYEDIPPQHNRYLEGNVYDNRQDVEWDGNVYDNSAFENPELPPVGAVPEGDIGHQPSNSSGSTVGPPLPPGHPPPSLYATPVRDHSNSDDSN